MQQLLELLPDAQRPLIRLIDTRLDQPQAIQDVLPVLSFPDLDLSCELRISGFSRLLCSVPHAQLFPAGQAQEQPILRIPAASPRFDVRNLIGWHKIVALEVDHSAPSFLRPPEQK